MMFGDGNVAVSGPLCQCGVWMVVCCQSIVRRSTR